MWRGDGNCGGLYREIVASYWDSLIFSCRLQSKFMCIVRY